MIQSSESHQVQQMGVIYNHETNNSLYGLNIVYTGFVTVMQPIKNSQTLT